MSKAFLTGSHVYGRPHDESDIDLVVRMEKSEINRLLSLLPLHQVGNLEQSGSDNGIPSIRVGNLNLIMCDSDAEYSIWKDGTEKLSSHRLKCGPVTRVHAVEYFDFIRDQRTKKQPVVTEDDPFSIDAEIV